MTHVLLACCFHADISKEDKLILLVQSAIGGLYL